MQMTLLEKFGFGERPAYTIENPYKGLNKLAKTPIFKQSKHHKASVLRFKARHKKRK